MLVYLQFLNTHLSIDYHHPHYWEEVYSPDHTCEPIQVSPLNAAINLHHSKSFHQYHLLKKIKAWNLDWLYWKLSGASRANIWLRKHIENIKQKFYFFGHIKFLLAKKSLLIAVKNLNFWLLLSFKLLTQKVLFY